ncbi:hypothetical protein EON80_07995 [bacterium]|nr:MAG: hypothetical protein EON80_07995 [bacterium]
MKKAHRIAASLGILSVVGALILKPGNALQASGFPLEPVRVLSQSQGGFSFHICYMHVVVKEDERQKGSSALDGLPCDSTYYRMWTEIYKDFYPPFNENLRIGNMNVINDDGVKCRHRMVFSKMPDGLIEVYDVALVMDE